jgi:hypothetical protein
MIKYLLKLIEKHIFFIIAFYGCFLSVNKYGPTGRRSLPVVGHVGMKRPTRVPWRLSLALGLNEAETREPFRWMHTTPEDRLLADFWSRVGGVFVTEVHLGRIRSTKSYESTERMLTTTENSRQPIYRDAAELVRDHARLFDWQPDVIRQLLS